MFKLGLTQADDVIQSPIAATITTITDSYITQLKKDPKTIIEDKLVDSALHLPDLDNNNNNKSPGNHNNNVNRDSVSLSRMTKSIWTWKDLLDDFEVGDHMKLWSD